MSASQFEEFERRMKRISKRHSKLSHGFVTKVNDDGLVVAKPRKKSSGAMLRGLILIVVTLFVFKGFSHANLGPEAYQERIEKLAGGNIIEQAGAIAMTEEPITLWLSSIIVSLVR